MNFVSFCDSPIQPSTLEFYPYFSSLHLAQKVQQHIVPSLCAHVQTSKLYLVYHYVKTKEIQYILHFLQVIRRHNIKESLTKDPKLLIFQIKYARAQITTISTTELIKGFTHGSETCKWGSKLVHRHVLFDPTSKKFYF